jgi:hypothetical protein
VSAPLSSRLLAKADDGADVALDDLVQRRIVPGMVVRFRFVLPAPFHDTIPFCPVSPGHTGDCPRPRSSQKRIGAPAAVLLLSENTLS